MTAGTFYQRSVLPHISCKHGSLTSNGFLLSDIHNPPTRTCYHIDEKLSKIKVPRQWPMDDINNHCPNTILPSLSMAGVLRKNVMNIKNLIFSE